MTLPLPDLAVNGLANASAWAVYGVGAFLAVVGAFGVVVFRNPVHCALSLVTTIFGIAMLFIDQGADFLAAVQIIVYAGAIVILFLFVIMLLGVDKREPFGQGGPLRGMLPAGVAVGIVALAELLVLARVHYWATGITSATEAANGKGENVQKLGQSIFTAYLLPFEMTSALLVIAVVAAVALVRRSTEDTTQPSRPGQGHRGPARPSSPGFTHAGMAAPAPGTNPRGVPVADQPGPVSPSPVSPRSSTGGSVPPAGTPTTGPQEGAI